MRTLILGLQTGAFLAHPLLLSDHHGYCISQARCVQRTKGLYSVLCSRKMKVLESLIGMIQRFPYDDPTYDKLHEDLDRIRGKFRQVCSLRVSFCLPRGGCAGPGSVLCACE